LSGRQGEISLKGEVSNHKGISDEKYYDAVPSAALRRASHNLRVSGDAAAGTSMEMRTI
jgi:hypothetical protein